MAALIKISGLAVSRRLFQYVLSKKNHSLVRQFTASLNDIFRCTLAVTPPLPANRFRCVMNCVHEVHYSSKSVKDKPDSLDSLVDYENVAEETLQSIYDRFEEVLQNSSFDDWDANYSNGVLTVSLEKHCVYVINKQTPNRQIWFSSPVSGPKRYDYINGTWIYKHDGVSLHQVLTDELSQLIQNKADFFICTFSNK